MKMVFWAAEPPALRERRGQTVLASKNHFHLVLERKEKGCGARVSFLKNSSFYGTSVLALFLRRL